MKHFTFKFSFLKNRGFIFLEIIIAVALIGIVFITLLGIGFSSLNVSTSLQKQSKADVLAKEEIEAVRAFRDSTASTWSSSGLGFYNVNTDYHLILGGSPPAWSISAGTETIGEFTRKVVFGNVMRDGGGNIVESGGTNDPDTRKVTATVTYNNKTHQLTAYFTNWQK